VTREGPVRTSVPGGDGWATRLAAGPPLALSMTKTMLNNAFAVSMDQALEDEGRCQTVNFGTADTAEAMSAFVQKRDPVFEGRWPAGPWLAGRPSHPLGRFVANARAPAHGTPR